jgi:DNA polymerase-3 subunit alpha
VAEGVRVRIDEIKRMNIALLPPSVVQSSVDFRPAKTEEGEEAILFGLGAVKGVGAAALQSILEERQKERFVDLEDFLSRIDSQKANKKVLESLIKSGSMDNFGYTRKTLLFNVEALVEAAHESSRAKKEAVGSLFGDDEEMVKANISISDIPEYALKEILEFEKETLGFYVSGHPLDSYSDELAKINYTLSSELEDLADGSDTMIIGRVEEIKTKISKKNNRKFAILTIMDLHGSLELMVFDDHLKINLNGRGMYVKNRFADWGAIGAAIVMDPSQSVYDKDSPYGGYFTWTGDDDNVIQVATKNPVSMLEMLLI